MKLLKGPKRQRYFLAFYDPLDESAPLEPLERRFVPRSFTDALAFVREYNEAAVSEPLLTKLIGLFPAPKLRSNIGGSQSDVKFERST
jgi:hypothetical protein